MLKEMVQNAKNIMKNKTYKKPQLFSIRSLYRWASRNFKKKYSDVNQHKSIKIIEVKKLTQL